MRSGLLRALQFLLAKLARDPYRIWIALVAICGTAGIALVWARGGHPWQSLLSALVGMLFGTLLLWSVRLAASRALRKEALGFGDVTLMAMIGTFLGWQPTMMVFFLAPFFAIGIALANLLVRGGREIPYGPYLSAATLAVILGWPLLWSRWGVLFLLGWWIPCVLLACVALMWLMLAAWRRWTCSR
jgi:prepilin signal peptidase PulO-like enzyme (type II secretory pathway)